MSGTEEMRGLTLWQPWAAWIVHGSKRTENRSWPPPKWLIGQRIAIHAGKHYDMNAKYKCGTELGTWNMASGAIVGTAVVVGVLTEDSAAAARDPWFTGPYGWELADVRVLCLPIPYRGMLGLWRVPRHISSILLENVT